MFNKCRTNRLDPNNDSNQHLRVFLSHWRWLSVRAPKLRRKNCRLRRPRPPSSTSLLLWNIKTPFNLCVNWSRFLICNIDRWHFANKDQQSALTSNLRQIEFIELRGANALGITKQMIARPRSPVFALLMQFRLDYDHTVRLDFIENFRNVTDKFKVFRIFLKNDIRFHQLVCCKTRKPWTSCKDFDPPALSPQISISQASQFQTRHCKITSIINYIWIGGR